MPARFWDVELSSRVGFGDIYGNSLRATKVGLTAAEVKALNTTPQTLVTAPGAAKFIQIVKIVAYLEYSTAAFTGSNNLEFRETNGSGTKISADLTYAFLNGSASAIVEISGIEAQTTRILNAPIVVAVPTADPGGASALSSLTFTIIYRVIDP